MEKREFRFGLLLSRCICVAFSFKMFKRTLQLVLIVTCLLPFGIAGCGQRTLGTPTKQSRISGGHSALEGAWPWQVSIQQMFWHICGGSIISHRWVITASHCFKKNRNNNKLLVVAGVISRFKPGKGVQYRTVQKVILHEKYKQSEYDNDVALLYLHHPFYFTNYVQPVCILENQMDEKQLNFGSCYITGWGSSVLEGKLYNTLQEAEVELIDTRICNQRSWHNGHVNDNMICAGFETGGVDTCQGDSGGPLQCYSQDKERFYLFGVTSHGDGCALPKKPGIYVRASRYTDWLRKAQAISISAAPVTDLPVFILISALFFSAWMGLSM